MPKPFVSPFALAEHPAPAPFDLPNSPWQAMARGARGYCPRCNDTRLFMRFLKPVSHCENCGQDWSLQRADDFPAYVSIFLTGHLLVPFIGVLLLAFDMSTAMVMAVLMPVAIAMLLAFLQPAKGAVIAMQWWLGMHGFKRERPAGVD
ncbi:MAG: DUF983 domain-containing protein [Rhizobiaceae bacterium]